MTTEFVESLRDAGLRANYWQYRDEKTYGPFPTWTTMGQPVPLLFDPETGVHVPPPPAKWFFETLSPTEYDRLYRDVVDWSLESAKLGMPVPPLNERAHLSVLVVDVDDGDVPLCEMVAYGRAMQNAAQVHLGIATSFVLAGRLTSAGVKKYHLFFPEVVMADMRVWFVLKAMTEPFVSGTKKKIDTAPTFARNIRMHGSQRTLGDSTGVYQVIVAYGSSYRPMSVALCYPYTSVRPSSAVLAAWMMNPHVSVKTSVAAARLKEVDGGASVDVGCFVLDNDRESLRELILTDRKGAWALREVRRKCARCDDPTICRVLFRLSDTTVYRWSLCCTCKDLVSLPTKTFEPTGNLTDRFMSMAQVFEYNVAAQSHIYNLPLELVCQNGLCVDEAQTITRLLGANSVDVNYLARLMGGSGQWHTTKINLTGAQCGRTDIQLPRLSTGLALHPIPDFDGAERSYKQFVTIQAPCGGGKTTVVLEMIVNSPKTLVLAIRKSLTLELYTKINKAMADAGTEKRVCYYKDIKRPNPLDISTNDVLVVTPESLAKYTMTASGYEFRAELLVVDEICSVIKTLYDSTTTQARRMEIQTALLAAMAHAKRVVFMDKDIGFGERLFLASALCHLEKLEWPVELGVFHHGPPPFSLVHVKLEDEVKRRVVMWPDRPTFMQALVDKFTDDDEASVAVFCAMKIDAFTTAEYFKTNMPDVSVYLLTGSSAEGEKEAFSADPNGVLGEKQVRLFIYTSTIGVGISIDEHHFTDVFVILGGHMTWRDALQGEARIRKLDGQSLWYREINVWANNVAANEFATDVMPTIGTAMFEAQYQIASSFALRHATANTEQVNVTGSPMLSETPLGIVEAVTAGIHALEIKWQMHMLFEWARKHELIWEVSTKADLAEVTAEIQLARKSGIELRRTQDMLDEDDDQLTQTSKRARITEAIGNQAPELIDAVASNADYLDWQKNRLVCTKVWYGVHLLLCRQAVVAELDDVQINKLHSLDKCRTSLIGPARLAMACAAVCGAETVFDGEKLDLLMYNSAAQFVSPIDGYSTWTPDRLFEWLSEMPLYSQKGAVTHGVVAQLRAFTKPYRETPEMTDVQKQAARVTFACRALKALLGLTRVIDDPKKLIWATRAHYNNEAVFGAVQIEGCPW